MEDRNGGGRREPTRRATTILEVARRAGVSTATVSRVLTKPETVTEATRSRVIAAIEATGFTPNATARNLRARSTKIVLALIPGLSNTFFTPILNAIEDTLSAAGYGMIIGDTRNSATKESHYARLIRGGQVDGLILFTGQLPHEAESVIRAGRPPVALVCNEIANETDFAVFDVNNRESGRMAVECLLDAGHRRIGHIVGPSRHAESSERTLGYRDALDAAGIAIDDSLIWGDSFRADSGIESARRFLASADRPTAIFASADESAIGFIKTIQNAGMSIPDDVSVIGFDDLEHTDITNPPLTTIHQPRAALGHAAAAYMLKCMDSDSPAPPPIGVRLACRLIVRGSVRRLDGTEIAQPSTALRGPAISTGAEVPR